MEAETVNVQEVSYQLGSLTITLVDTPGFDDTTRSDAEVLQTLAQWMEKSFIAGTLLSGIIYLHRITDPRMKNTSMRNLQLFRKLCGEENLSNIVLVTNMWETISMAEGEEKERELVRTGEF